MRYGILGIASFAITMNMAIDVDSSDNDYVQAVHHTMWATFLHKDKKSNDAQNWYQTITQKPVSPYSLKSYILFLAETDNYKKIASYIPEYSQQFAHDATIQATFAHALAKTGKEAEANELFIQLNKTFPTNQDIAFQAVQALAHKKEMGQALTIAQEIINKSTQKQSNFIFYFLQAQLNVQLGKLEEARAAAQECLALQPHFFKAWLMVGLVEEQLGNIDKAIQGYRSFLETSQQRNTHIEQHILALTLKQTTAQPTTGLPMPRNPSLEKTILLLKQKQYDQALKSVDQCIAQSPKNPHNKLLKIQILMDMKRHDDALALVVSWIKKEPKQQIWFSALHLLARMGIKEQALINALCSVKKSMPHNQWATLYLADLYMRTQTYDDALEQLKQACEQTNDALLKADLYFYSACIHYERRAFDLVAHALEQGLAQQQLHAPLLNMSAYFYATKGKNINKAEELITQALRLEPSNQHYLDTRAVILYKQGEYDKAELLLSGLLAQTNHDGTIMLNLAKTKYKLGKVDEARTLLKQAQAVAHNMHERTTIATLEQKWQAQ